MGILNVAAAWIVSFITAVAPPGRKIYYPEAQETADEATARYESIAQDIMDVVYDPNVRPLFKGPDGRSKTAAVILSVMFHESRFLKHVDYNIGKYARGDHGQSWCMMQLKIGEGRTLRWNTVHDRPPVWGDAPEEISEGYTGEELIQDRKLCIREGLKVLRISFGACGKLPIEDRLRSYASGSCEKGISASRARMRGAIHWFGKTYRDRQFTDEQVTQTLLLQRLHPEASELVAEPGQAIL